MSYGFSNPANISHLREAIHGALEYLCHSSLDKPGFDFRNAFAATDTLLDIEEALYSVTHLDWPDDLGQSYIYGIGILQALVVQQDSVRQLCDAIGIPHRIFADKELKRIRDYRVRAAGHPSNHQKPAHGSTFLVREIFTKNSVKFITYFHDELPSEHSDINLSALINMQENILAKMLRLAWAKILSNFPTAAERGWNPWIAIETYPAPPILAGLMSRL